MKPRYIPAFITLTACTVTCLISIIKKFEVLYSLKILLLILIVFYIIGCIAKGIIVKVTTIKKDEGAVEASTAVDNEKDTITDKNSAEESETTASTQ